MKSFFKDAQYHKDQKDYKLKHGQSENGVQAAGIRLYKPLDADGKELPSSSLITTEHGQVKLYDGIARVIDGEYWDAEVKKNIEREEQIEDISYKILKAGPILAQQVLGVFFNYLSPVTNSNALFNFAYWLRTDGFDQVQIEAYIKMLRTVDARPQTFKTMNEASAEYTIALSKLFLVVRYCGIVITNKHVTANADPGVQSGESLNDPNDPEKGSIRGAREIAARVGRDATELFS
jgi:hypothetical protein